MRLEVQSCGAGVQSTAIALLIADGVLPRPDAAIFADTRWEPARVYAHLDRLEAEVYRPLGIPLYRVSNGELRRTLTGEATRLKADGTPAKGFASIPYYTLSSGGRNGIGRRHCTSEYKLVPIRRKTRELLGSKPPYRRVPTGAVARTWVGFSTDEIVRVSDRAPRYCPPYFPLIELGWSRTRCESYLTERGWSDTPKSACIGCPFHRDHAWRQLRDDAPDEWADAVAVDAAIRKGGPASKPLDGEAFLHSQRVPLPLVDLSTPEDHGQGELFVGCSPFGCRSSMRTGRRKAA